jgi:homocysteine S-methyltransferase
MDTPETIWSAHGLLVAPEVVHQIHLDYVLVGADVITTNTYGIIHNDLAKVGIEDHFE